MSKEKRNRTKKDEEEKDRIIRGNNDIDRFKGSLPEKDRIEFEEDWKAYMDERRRLLENEDK